MGRQKKQLIIFLGIIIVLIIAYLGMKYVKESKEEETQETESYAVTSIDNSTVTAVQIVNEQGSISLLREEDSWVTKEEAGISIDAAAVEDLVRTVGSINGTNRIDDVNDMSEYGLDRAKITVKITIQEDQEMVLSLGDYNEITSQYYLRVGEESTVYTVESNIYTSCNITIADVTLEEQAMKKVKSFSGDRI